MASESTILVASFDPQLADVRKHVLESAGYQVIPAKNLLEIRAACETGHHIGLVIIGHSLPAREKRRVREEVRQVCGAGTPVLELHEGEGPVLADAIAINGHLSQSADDFIENVRGLLRR